MSLVLVLIVCLYFQSSVLFSLCCLSGFFFLNGGTLSFLVNNSIISIEYNSLVYCNTFLSLFFQEITGIASHLFHGVYISFDHHYISK